MDVVEGLGSTSLVVWEEFEGATSFWNGALVCNATLGSSLIGTTGFSWSNYIIWFSPLGVWGSLGWYLTRLLDFFIFSIGWWEVLFKWY